MRDLLSFLFVCTEGQLFLAGNFFGFLVPAGFIEAKKQSTEFGSSGVVNSLSNDLAGHDL